MTAKGHCWTDRAKRMPHGVPKGAEHRRQVRDAIRRLRHGCLHQEVVHGGFAESMSELPLLLPCGRFPHCADEERSEELEWATLADVPPLPTASADLKPLWFGGATSPVWPQLATELLACPEAGSLPTVQEVRTNVVAEADAIASLTRSLNSPQTGEHGGDGRARDNKLASQAEDVGALGATRSNGREMTEGQSGHRNTPWLCLAVIPNDNGMCFVPACFEHNCTCCRHRAADHNARPTTAGGAETPCARRSRSQRGSCLRCLLDGPGRQAGLGKGDNGLLGAPTPGPTSECLLTDLGANTPLSPLRTALKSGHGRLHKTGMRA